MQSLYTASLLFDSRSEKLLNLRVISLIDRLYQNQNIGIYLS